MTGPYRKIRCNDGSGCDCGYNLVADSVNEHYIIHVNTNDEELVDAMLEAVNKVAQQRKQSNPGTHRSKTSTLT